MKEHTIVLSPGPADEAGSFHECVGGVYAGGQIRMDAARRVMHQRPKSTIYLVGGYDITSNGTHSSDKVEDMFRYLRETHLDVSERIVSVPSLPCTYHNLIAVFRILRQDIISSGSEMRLSILTNAYHHKRVRLLAARASEAMMPPGFRVQYTELAAEAILGISAKTLAKRYPDAYQRRVDMEKQGVKDLMKSSYTDSCYRLYGVALRPIVEQLRDKLVAEEELSKWLTPVDELDVLA